MVPAGPRRSALRARVACGVCLQLKRLLDDRLPHVYAGKSVYEAQIPWPPAKDVEEDAVIPL